MTENTQPENNNQGNEQPQAAPAAPAAEPYVAAPAAQQYVAAPAAGQPGPGEPFDGAASPEDLSRPLYGATFGQAIKRFYKNYATFSGRASRSEYWWVYLYLFLLSLVPGILALAGFVMLISSATAIDTVSDYATLSPQDAENFANNFAVGLAAAGTGSIMLLLVGSLLIAAIVLAHIVPSISIAWRRLHDANLPGPLWFINLASIVPFIGQALAGPAAIAMIVLHCLPSKAEARAKYPSTKA